MPGVLNVGQKVIQDQDDYQVENRQILRNLSSQFGREIVQNIWGKLSEERQGSILEGRISLKAHEDAFVKKCSKLLIDRVLSTKQEALSQLHVSKSAIQQHFSNYSVEELRSMTESPELSDADIQTIQKQSEDVGTIAFQNKELLATLAESYSQSIVDKVLAKLSASKRQQVEEGSLNLSDHLDSFKEACEKIASPKQWMSDSDLSAFFRTGKVVERKSGYNGVLIVEGTYQGKTLKLVIKCPEKIAQETFGSKVMETLNIRSPSFQVASSQENGVFEAAIELFERDGNVAAEERQHYEQAGYMFIMEYLSGDTLEDLDAQTVQTTLATDPDAMYDKVLFEIGEIAAADLLLYYKDRLPLLGMGNLANAMILKSEEGTYHKSAAIDQVAYLSTTQTGLEQAMGICPFQRIQSLVEEIIASPQEISAPAQDLFTSALSDDVQSLLDQNRAESALQKGLESGLVKILNTQEASLTDIHLALPESSNARDQVDLPAYQKMLHLIQSVEGITRLVE